MAYNAQIDAMRQTNLKSPYFRGFFAILKHKYIIFYIFVLKIYKILYILFGGLENSAYLCFRKQTEILIKRAAQLIKLCKRL